MIMYGTDAAWHASTFLKHTLGRPSDCEAAVHHSWHSCAHKKYSRNAFDHQFTGPRQTPMQVF